MMILAMFVHMLAMKILDMFEKKLKRLELHSRITFAIQVKLHCMDRLEITCGTTNTLIAIENGTAF